MFEDYAIDTIRVISRLYSFPPERKPKKPAIARAAWRSTAIFKSIAAGDTTNYEFKSGFRTVGLDRMSIRDENCVPKNICCIDETSIDKPTTMVYNTSIPYQEWRRKQVL